MKWICKLNKYGQQYRITLPKKLVEQKLMTKTKYLELDDREYSKIIIRRLREHG